MVPKPQTNAEVKFDRIGNHDGDAVVISGISGLYPRCKSVKEFGEILYDKINPVSDQYARWQSNHPEASRFIGTVPDLERFDAQFFKVHYRLGTSMDAMSKKILEQCYQALYDAGINLETINGKKVAVFCGACFSETEKAAFYVAKARTGFGVVGCNKSMFANRISYWLNLKGPSMAIDESCCSSAGALTQAYHAMSRGECEAAIVAGSNLFLHPQSTIHTGRGPSMAIDESCFSSAGALTQAYHAMSRGECEAAIVAGSNLFLHPQSSIHTGRIIDNAPDGKTKCFDERADGSAKSEAIQVVFLQKAKDALRIYAELVYIKNEYVNACDQESGVGFYRDPALMTNFLKNFYERANISPEAVEYVEAMGAAIPEVDKAELEAISNVFCKDRNNPLLVGSVMSNIGYTEASSGLCSVVKALLAYQTGKIPANLHLTNPRKDIPALLDGRMSIVTETEPFRRGYVAINNHSITGCTAHILLNGRYKPKDCSRYKSSIPHLVTISARQQSSVQPIFDDFKSRPVDPEELALFHNIHKANISGHLGRGFIILDTDKDQKTVSLVEKSEYFDNARRPLWFVYSGMGSQWPGMGTQLMRIPIFAAAIERCQRALEPMGIDLVHILTSTDKHIFDNILHSFVGIAAVQIGLTDVLREIGLVPDKIIGHSVGELGCAYGDGCFTAEEMILSAYSRGLVSIQTPFIRGSMAAVGIGYQEIKEMLPPEIEVACHNSATSSTISGPADLMKEFVASLVAKGIFAKEVPCSNIAYHSRYIAEAGPKLLTKLSEVIKEPKERSDRWISTSVPQENWEQPMAKTSSAEYHTNNLLNPVLFEEASVMIPADAILVEIAPHGLLQAILKRALPESCKHIPLTRRGHPDNALMVLEGIGTLYLEGYNVNISALYPKIEFPVSTGTPMLSHLVEWAHNEKWVLPLYVAARTKTAAALDNVICTRDPEYAYLEGHVVQGRNGYPFAAALVSAWKTLAMYMHKQKEEMSVSFHDVQFFAEPILTDRQLKIGVAIHKGQGYFEVMEGKSKVASGYINQTVLKTSDTNVQTEPKEMTFSSKDIYQILYDRDYQYHDEFRSIHATNESFTKAQLRWQDNWVTLIDGMIQLNILRQKHHAVSKPMRMRKLVINTAEHYLAVTAKSDDEVIIDASVDELANVTRCGGVHIDSIQFDNLPRSSAEVAVINTLQFVPYFNFSPSDLKTSIQVSLQIVAENVNKKSLNVIEVVNTAEKTASFQDVKADYVPGLEINHRQCNKKELLAEDLKKVDLVLVQSLSIDDDLCKHLHSVLKNNVLILSAEEKSQNTRTRPSSVYKVVASQNAGDIVINLLKWRPYSQSSTTAITVRTQTELSMLLSTRNCLGPNQKLLVVTSYPPVPYTKELVENWRKEPIRNEIYLVMVNHSAKEDEGMFEIPDLELAINIHNEGVWGGEYYIPLKNEPAAAPYVTLRSKNIGDLKSLSWVELPKPVATGIPVTVHYAALNTVDSMKAAGVYRVKEGNDVDDISYGMDFSGVTESGVRVMGLVESGAASNWVSAHRELLWPVPKHWTLEDAATVPMPYAMAFYCLVIKCRMLPNTSILIHGGAGALGQAAISIALANGVQVFTTVSDIRKKHFLRKLFPDLKEDHIGNSRDFSFRDMVMTATKGRGVKYVLNCLKGEFKDVSITCAGAFSVCIDTSQIHSDEYYSYQLKNLFKEGCYMRVDFASVFNNKIDKLKLQYLIGEGIARGYVRPLSRVTYATTEVARAFRLLEASQHRGRVLLTLNETPKGQPRITCSPNHTQIVICNDQTFGVHVADRLVRRGARKLLLQLPTLTPQLLYKKRVWQEVGAIVNMYTSNLNTEKNIKEMLTTAARMGDVEGIYIVATQSDSDITRDTIQSLDLNSRKLCPSLKNYVLVSSDDKFGNDLCLSRVQQKLPANKICIPPISMVDDEKSKPSEEGISISVACDAFESALRSKQTITKANVQKSKEVAILKDIARISDINLPEIMNEEDTLLDLGISIDKEQPIAALLQKDYHYALTKDVLELTVKEIRELEDVINGKEMEETKGWNKFFSHFDIDELTSTADLMLVPTLFDHAMLRENDFDTTQSYLCITPGLEGHYERFRMLCERLKMPAIVVQPALDESYGSIKQLAARNAQLLIKKVNIKDNFYLLGYESGALVALETAAILEEHGLTGTVYIIGAPAEHFKAYLKKEIEQYGDDKELQKALLKHMYELITNTEFNLKLDDDLEWNERVEKCMKDLLKHTPLSAEYARLNLKMPFSRIKQALEYEPDLPTLQSKLVLLQPKDLSEDEIPAALQKLTKQPIAVHKLTMPLANALEDLESATFINQHLDDTILETFNTKNLCVTYLLNTIDNFMSVDNDPVEN